MCVWIPIKKHFFFIINYRVKTASRANHAKSIWPNQLQAKAQESQKFRFFSFSSLMSNMLMAPGKQSCHRPHCFHHVSGNISQKCVACVCVCVCTHMHACNCECKGWPRRRKWFWNDQINIIYWSIKQGYWHLSLVFFTRVANPQDSRWKSNLKNK